MLLFVRLQPGREHWGVDHSMHALKKEANWLRFVKLKPDKDPILENKMVQLRAKNNVDELLRAMCKFLTVTDHEVRFDCLAILAAQSFSLCGFSRHI